MFESLASLFGGILQSSRAVSIVALSAGSLAGLYGYQFLTPRSGLLRQFLVGLPSGALFGLLSLSLDIQAHFAYSETLLRILSQSNGSLSHYLFGLSGFVAGLLEAMVNPNNYRSDYISLPIIQRSIIFVLLVSDVSISGAAVLKVNADKIGIFAGQSPPEVVFIMVSLIIGVIVALATLTSPSVQRWIASRSGSGAPRSARVIAVASSLAILILALSIGLAYFSYSIVVLGWSFLAYIAIILLGIILLNIVQQRVDKMGDNALIYVSLAFFLIAVALQFYQIVAF
jgi:hypothetical protein